jgi:hypothetical protein
MAAAAVGRDRTIRDSPSPASVTPVFVSGGEGLRRWRRLVMTALVGAEFVSGEEGGGRISDGWVRNLG